MTLILTKINVVTADGRRLNCFHRDDFIASASIGRIWEGQLGMVWKK